MTATLTTVIDPSSLPAPILPSKPGQLAGAAMRPSSLFPFAGPADTAETAPASSRINPQAGAVLLSLPNRIPVGAQERRLPERQPAGFGTPDAGVVILFKAAVSCTISAIHRFERVLLHASAKLCAAPGEGGDCQKSADDGKRGHKFNLHPQLFG